MRARFPILAAGLLVLAAAAPVSAATVTEGFTVATEITVTNVPASLTYEAVGGGDIGPGDPSDAEMISPNVTSNGDVAVTFSGSNFTGPQALDESIREVMGSTGTGMTRNPAWSGSWTATNIVESYGSGSGLIYTGTAPVSGTFDLSLRVTPPVDAMPGAYSGSVVLTFTAS